MFEVKKTHTHKKNIKLIPILIFLSQGDKTIYAYYYILNHNKPILLLKVKYSKT